MVSHSYRSHTETRVPNLHRMSRSPQRRCYKGIRRAIEAKGTQGMELWLSGNALVLSLAAALVIAAWYLSPALASVWNLPTVAVRSVFVAVAVAAPLAVGSARLDTFWRAIIHRPLIALTLSLGLLVSIVVAAVQHDLLARLRVGFSVTLVTLLAITVPPEGSFGWHLQGLAECFTYSTTPGNNWLYDGAPNIVLYSAAGLLLTSLWRTSTKAALALTGLSTTIELYQALFTDRACQVTDFAANVVGAALGAGLAVAATHLGAQRSTA